MPIGTDSQPDAVKSSFMWQTLQLCGTEVSTCSLWLSTAPPLCACTYRFVPVAALLTCGYVRITSAQKLIQQPVLAKAISEWKAEY